MFWCSCSSVVPWLHPTPLLLMHALVSLPPTPPPRLSCNTPALLRPSLLITEMTYFKYLADLEPVEVRMMIGTCLDTVLARVQVCVCVCVCVCRGRPASHHTSALASLPHACGLPARPHTTQAVGVQKG
jgi:hypothetical protein